MKTIPASRNTVFIWPNKTRHTIWSGNMYLIIYRRTRFHSRVDCLLFSIKKSPLKNQDHQDAKRNRCVSNVKYGTKKFKLFATPYRKPAREFCVSNDREVKHINHFTMKKTGISTGKFFTEKRVCYILYVRVTVFENKSVKQTVDEIADSTGVY